MSLLVAMSVSPPVFAAPVCVTIQLHLESGAIPEPFFTSTPIPVGLTSPDLGPYASCLSPFFAMHLRLPAWIME